MTDRKRNWDPDDPTLDPATGKPIRDSMLHPWGASEDVVPQLDVFEQQIQFDQERIQNGLDVAFERFPNWKDITAPGDPYPIPRGEYVGETSIVNAKRPDGPRIVYGTMVDPSTEEAWVQTMMERLDKAAAALDLAKEMKSGDTTSGEGQTEVE